MVEICEILVKQLFENLNPVLSLQMRWYTWFFMADCMLPLHIFYVFIFIFELICKCSVLSVTKITFRLSFTQTKASASSRLKSAQLSPWSSIRNRKISCQAVNYSYYYLSTHSDEWEHVDSSIIYTIYLNILTLKSVEDGFRYTSTKTQFKCSKLFYNTSSLTLSKPELLSVIKFYNSFITIEQRKNIQ